MGIGKYFFIAYAVSLISFTIPSAFADTDDCDPSYPDVCIPPYPPDLDCGEIQYANFIVLQPDPHGFDADGDGIGCESGYVPPSTSEPSIQPQQEIYVHTLSYQYDSDDVIEILVRSVI